MRTDDLIATLSAELAPTPPGVFWRRVAIGTAGGTLAAALLWLGSMGPRADLAEAVVAWPFWMKFFYTLTIAVTGLWLLSRAGRPGATLLPPVLTLLVPIAAMIALAGLALMEPDADTHRLLMGHTGLWCPFAIALVSLPILAGSFWSLKKLAPTRLTLAGGAAGLFAGSSGAFVYAFYCTESAAPFVAIWYSLGTGLSSIVGALLGKTALRW